MSEAKDKTITLNVRLKPSESSAYPRATNYTNVGVAQGIAYVDFGFIEPTLLAGIAKTAKDGQAAPKGLDGTLAPAWPWAWTCWRGYTPADPASAGRPARCAAAETERLSPREVSNGEWTIARHDPHRTPIVVLVTGAGHQKFNERIAA